MLKGRQSPPAPMGYSSGEGTKTPRGDRIMKRMMVLIAAVAAFGIAGALGQDKTTRLSIGTGGTGGVYYPLGGGLAAIISKYVPGVEATAEVTAGSIANLQLIGRGECDVAFTIGRDSWG